MSLRKKIWLTFLAIIILSVLAGVVDFPKGPDIKIGKFQKELKVRLGLDLQGGTSLIYDADTSKITEADKASAMEGVREVIERRVNAFGVAEPVIQTNHSGNNWRIIVELAGIKDIDQAIKMIGETPTLVFKEQKTTELTADQLKSANESNDKTKSEAEDVLKKALIQDADFATLANEYSQDPGNTDPTTQEKKGGDLGFFTRSQMVTEFADVVFDKMKVGDIYPELVKTEYGYHIIKKTGESGDQAMASHILFMTQSTTPTTEYVDTGLSGTQLTRSAVEFNQQTNAPEVALEFNDEGKKLFADITTRNVGKVVGIYLDGEPISMPQVNTPITDGKAVINGSFDLAEAKLLAQRLNAGALPVPIKLVSQQNVGATLGKLAIQKSLFAGLVGLSLVAIFMIVYYRLPGLLAVFALFIYSLIVLAIFKLFNITLTLAGIAGYILSIGMAVDANVLIFERSKEELRANKNVGMAIEEGFKRAWSSIRDSNASSLITCVILAWFGTSMVKGFAITLGIGVLASMFSAITVTRTFLRLISPQWLEKHLQWFGNIKLLAQKDSQTEHHV